MKQMYPIYWPQYFTATINEWKPLLSSDKHKNIIVDSLQFLVAKKRINLNAFVLMSNHIHLIWQPLFGFTPSAIQSSFMKFTAGQFKRSLEENDKVLLEQYSVNKYDRTYHPDSNRIGVKLRVHFRGFP